MKSYIKRIASLLSTLSLVSLLALQVEAEDKASAYQKGGSSIADIVERSSNFSTLVAAARAAGLAKMLDSDGPFTLFAPTDVAFSKLPEGTLEELLLPENKKKLKELLTHHMLKGQVMSDDVSSGDVKTVSGEDATIEVGETGVTIDGARVIATDVLASNGVIHVIDKVMLPEE